MELDLTHYGPERAHLIERAWRLAHKHGLDGTTSLEGTTSIYDGHETAKLLIEWQLDAETVAASLLIPLIFNYPQEHQALAEATSPACLKLAQATLRLAELNSRLSRQPQYAQTPVNMRELLLAETADLRTLIIWLATRLIALRLQTDPKLQRVVAERCRHIYAPLADLLGMWKVKAELEEYSFKILEPKLYGDLNRLFRRRYKQLDRFLAATKHELRQVLSENGMSDFEISGRRKQLSSIAKKLVKKKNDVGQIYDLVALRVIVPTTDDCYRALSIIHKHWEPVTEEIDDYIARPKPNGYRSIHTAVFGIKGGAIEIQLRTPVMHREAEEGLAAHFYYDQYKQTKSYHQGKSAPAATPVADITKLHEALRGHRVVNPSKLKMKLFRQAVYVFSPKGDLYNLPRGAVALDFAFAVHTDIGLRAKAVKVNGSIAKLDQPLSNGDSVEVLTNKEPKPRPDWVKIVRSPKAKSKIRSHLETTVG